MQCSDPDEALWPTRGRVTSGGPPPDHSPRAPSLTMRPVLLDPEKHWECPSCGRQHVTRTHLVTSELHRCPALRGMIAPFVEVTSNAGIRKHSMRHTVIERGDYIGQEVGVRHDAEGKAVMAVHTERADGSHDTHVFAPAAHAKVEL